MKKKPFVAQTSMVPILACIAALLFSANFYQFMQKNFKKWWGWDFQCPLEQVDCHEMHIHTAPGVDRHEHRRHHHKYRRHHHKHRRHHRQGEHRHDVRDRQTIILDFEGQRNLQDAERKLERTLDRALRDLEQLHERMEWDADINVDVKVERLENEIRIKVENLENLERIKRRLRLHSSNQDSPDVIVREFHIGDDNVEIRIRDHR